METLSRLSSHLLTAFFCLFLSTGPVLAADTPSVEKQPGPSEKNTPQDFLDEATGIDFVWVEGGCFRMGDPNDKSAPPHEVCVDGYWIGKTEVTLAQWNKIIGGQYSSETVDQQLPVSDISWHDTDYFINKIRRETGNLYRLPSEAEWEFAARGGNKNANASNTPVNNLEAVAWCNEDQRDEPHPVMGKQPNALGLYDMLGNVNEWCRDWFHSDYYRSSPREAPAGPAHGSLRAIRGGSWLGSNYECRLTTRDAYLPLASHSSIGFRLVLPGKQKRESFYDEVSSMRFIWVEGGCFQMGSTHGATDETPVHEVCVDGFWLGETEVTQAQWQKIMEFNPSLYKEPLLPVSDITWNQSLGYLSRLSSQAQRTYRLPTEAEWEFAARGGLDSKGSQYCGSKQINEVAWFSDNSHKETSPVRLKRPNELGLYDMSGNVAEWCNDWYRVSSYRGATKYNPQGPEISQFKSLRGGHIFSGKEGCRVSARDSGSPAGKGAYIGLRVALSGDQIDLSLLEKSDDKTVGKAAAKVVPSPIRAAAAKE